MKRSVLRKAVILVIAAVMSAISAFGVFAETAKEVKQESGRSVIVQDVKLPDAYSTASVVRGFQEFAPAAGVRLAGGDRLVTKGNATIYLTVDAKIVLRLDGNSEAVIEKSILGQKLSVKLKKGGMFYNVASQTAENESLELMTNNVSIAIRGTSGYLVAENSRVTHMLFDGHIEVSDGKHTLVQKPGESFDTKMGPSGDMTENLYLDTFLLSEIPQSVVTEMLADKALEERILTSLPAGADENGAPVYADDAAFRQELVHTYTDEVSIAEVRNDPKEPEPDPAPAPKPVPEPEPVPKHICPACGKEAEHEKRLCTACKEAGKPESEYTYYVCDKEAVTFHEDTHFTPECQTHKDVTACQAAKHKLEWMCEYCGLRSYACEPLDPSEKEKHRLKKCESCGREYCLGDAEECRNHAYVRTCECGTKIYACSTQEEIDRHAEATYDCDETGPACKASEHALITEKCPHCEQKVCACYPTKDWHTTKVNTGCGHDIYQCQPDSVDKAHEKRICQACKAAGKPEVEYTYYACDKNAVEFHEKTVSYACGTHSGPACQKDAHAQGELCACGNHYSYACWTDAMKAEHALEWSCPDCALNSYKCAPLDTTVKELHRRITCGACTALASGTTPVTYCKHFEETAKQHHAICAACQASGKEKEYCPTAEIAEPKHHAVCSLANGGCGEVYCPISQESAHDLKGLAVCTMGHSIRKCLTTASPVFVLHYDRTAYTCPCGAKISSCNDLTAAHDAAYCTVCGSYHKKCLDCSGQPKTPAASPGGGGTFGAGADSLESSPKSDENSTDGGTGSAGLPSEDGDDTAPERMPYGEETVPEVAVECVAIVAAEATEEEDE